MHEEGMVLNLSQLFHALLPSWSQYLWPSMTSNFVLLSFVSTLVLSQSGMHVLNTFANIDISTV